MITAVFTGGPLDGQVIGMADAPDVYEVQHGGRAHRYVLRPMGRAHVRYEYVER